MTKNVLLTMQATHRSHYKNSCGHRHSGNGFFIIPLFFFFVIFRVSFWPLFFIFVIFILASQSNRRDYKNYYPQNTPYTGFNTNTSYEPQFSKPVSQVNFCKNCGHSVEQDAVYCSDCGSKVN